MRGESGIEGSVIQEEESRKRDRNGMRGGMGRGSEELQSLERAPTEEMRRK